MRGTLPEMGLGVKRDITIPLTDPFMGMEALRCLSPKMVHKELEMFFIAYNFIRCLMAEAAQAYDVEIQRLSFKGTVDSLRQFSIALAQARSRRKKTSCWPGSWN